MTTNTTTSALPLAPGRWVLDPNHSAVGFTIRHLGVSKVRGHFRTFDAELVVGDDLASTSLTATIQIGSLDTGNSDRDAHVLSPDLLDVERRPTMTFRSTSITGSGHDYEVAGELTIGEVTRPTTLTVEFGGTEPFPGGPVHAGFEAYTEIRRKEFGIDIAMPPGVSGALLGDAVKVELDIQLLQPTDPS